MKRPEETLVRDERGAVYAETLIAFPIVLVVTLCVVQLALLYVAKLSTRSAAGRAARAAVVVLPDRPDRYDGEPVHEIDFDAAGTSEVADLRFGGEPSPGRGSARLRAIRSAAYLPLVPLAPSLVLDAETQSSVRTAYARGDASFVANAITYGRAATAVTFPVAPEADDFRETFDPYEPVVTRVTYLFHCGVPLVKRFMCDAAEELALPGAGAPQRDSGRRWSFGSLQRSGGPHSDVARAVDELGFVETPEAIAPWAARGRFLVLRAEAALPNQGAGYAWN
ncbi:MAG: hypothetical protein H6720_03455 [Sandaracinus sp.]|nr:hypothetical protein [Sandaracinus sp.]